MRTRSLLSVLVFGAICFLLFSACTSGVESTPVSDVELDAAQPALPPEFDGLTNPLSGSDEAVAQGASLYQVNCASCHGENGRGDGPAGVALEPKPSDLAAVESSYSDGYLFWRVSKGGMFEPFSSMMPGWDSILREEQIWQVISYIRELGSNG